MYGPVYRTFYFRAFPVKISSLFLVCLQFPSQQCRSCCRAIQLGRLQPQRLLILGFHSLGDPAKIRLSVCRPLAWSELPLKVATGCSVPLSIVPLSIMIASTSVPTFAWFTFMSWTLNLFGRACVQRSYVGLCCRQPPAHQDHVHCLDDRFEGLPSKVALYLGLCHPWDHVVQHVLLSFVVGCSSCPTHFKTKIFCCWPL